MHHLLILNDVPYGSENSYNGLRLAHALSQAAQDARVTVFLLGDAVGCARAGQQTPEGHYNRGHMLHRVSSAGGQVLTCGSCMEARGLQDDDLVAGAAHSTNAMLTPAVQAADKVLVF